MTSPTTSLRTAWVLGLAFAAAGACATPVGLGPEQGASGAAGQSAQPPEPVNNNGTNQANGVGSGGEGGGAGQAGAAGAAGEAGSGGEAGATGTGGAGGSGGVGGTDGGNEPDVILGEPGLSAWFSFEDTGTTITDSSGNQHVGAVAGSGVALGQAGKIGSAVSFTGFDGRISVPASSQLDFLQGATIEFWIRLNSVAAGAIVSRGTGNGDNHVRVKTAQGNLQVVFARAGQGSAVLTSDPGVIGSSWTHVAIVNDGSELRLYLDGKLNKTEPGGQLGYLGADLRIGKSAANDVALNGMLDELKWWTVARTEAEICSDAGGKWAPGEAGAGCDLP